MDSADDLIVERARHDAPPAIRVEPDVVPPTVAYRRYDRVWVTRSFLTAGPLWIADQAVILGSSALLVALFPNCLPQGTASPSTWIFGLSVVATCAFWCFGLYPGVGMSAPQELRKSTTAGALVFSAAAVWHLMWPGRGVDSVKVLLGTMAATMVFVPILRRVVRKKASQYNAWLQPAIIFGGGESAAAVYSALRRSPELGLRPLGIVDDLHRHWRDETTDPAWFAGTWSDAPDIIQSQHVNWGIIPLEQNGEADFARRVDQVAGLMPHLVVTFGSWSPLARLTSGQFALAEVPALRIDERLLMPSHQAGKWLLDLLLLAVTAVAVLPIIALLAVLVYVASPGPVFFSHPRVGRDGRTFRMWKFRSMVVDAERVLEECMHRDPRLREEWNRFHKLKQDPRITWIGRIMRRTSLDELPQWFNVLRGEMSFVGPRPYPLYEFEEMRRSAPVIMRVRPGITGLWQISGRSRSTFHDRLRVDSKYVSDWSPWLDLYILARTVKVVATCDGAY